MPTPSRFGVDAETAGRLPACSVAASSEPAYISSILDFKRSFHVRSVTARSEIVQLLLPYTALPRDARCTFPVRCHLSGIQIGEQDN